MTKVPQNLSEVTVELYKHWHENNYNNQWYQLMSMAQQLQIYRLLLSISKKFSPADNEFIKRINNIEKNIDNTNVIILNSMKSIQKTAKAINNKYSEMNIEELNPLFDEIRTVIESALNEYEITHDKFYKIWTQFDTEIEIPKLPPPPVITWIIKEKDFDD